MVQGWIVAPQLRSAPGLAAVDSLGGYVKQYLVTLDPQRVAALDLSLTDLATALERNNTSTGADIINRDGEAPAVRADARIRNAAGLARTVIATREGVPITLDQVAVVSTGQALRMVRCPSAGARW